MNREKNSEVPGVPTSGLGKRVNQRIVFGIVILVIEIESMFFFFLYYKSSWLV